MSASVPVGRGRLPLSPARAGRTDGGDTLRREEKAEAIAALTERLRSSDTIFATDFRGLTVKQLSELRDRLRAVETEYTVVKNTLARRAADDTGREALLPYLVGPTGIVWVDGDPALAAKALDQFATEHPGAMSVKGGLLEGKDLPSADVARLAKLPSREVLLAQLAGTIASPLTGLAGGMNNLIGGLARSLGALQAQKESQESAAA
jgi:large subunit ribosomal protein L10